MSTIRYRQLTSSGDYRFGGGAVFLVDSPDAVRQAILTRLKLGVGDWFLDLDEGTDYRGSILGYGTQGTRDLEIQDRILGTPGVLEIVSYESVVDAVKRSFTVSATVSTVFGQTTFELTR